MSAAPTESSFSASPSRATAASSALPGRISTSSNLASARITQRSRGISFAQRCAELRRYFQGWVGYFSAGAAIKSFFDELDKWVRRRIRMCIWESWKNRRTRAAALMKLGVPEHEAFTHGMSSKGPWVLSSSQAVHQALPVALLEERGLPSLLGIWKKLTAKNRTA